MHVTQCRYIGIQEKEFEWLTEQLVALANKYCQGRIVSALEGGYRIQGGIVSAFARSVASHVRALSQPGRPEWSWADVKAEQQREKQRKVRGTACQSAAECVMNCSEMCPVGMTAVQVWRCVTWSLLSALVSHSRTSSRCIKGQAMTAWMLVKQEEETRK